MPNPTEILRVINGNTVSVLQDGSERYLTVARVCTFPQVVFTDIAQQYISNMLDYDYRIEITEGTVEIFVTAFGEEFNLSDQMIQLGLALPCS